MTSPRRRFGALIRMFEAVGWTASSQNTGGDVYMLIARPASEPEDAPACVFPDPGWFPVGTFWITSGGDSPPELQHVRFAPDDAGIDSLESGNERAGVFVRRAVEAALATWRTFSDE